MRKTLIYSITALVLFFGLYGCSKDWLDVNQDPNNPANASAELAFPAGVLSVGATGGGYYNLIGGFWSQYWAQSNSANQYKYIDQYQITSSDFNGQWREMYSNGLSDLNYVIAESEAKENWTFYLMGTVMQAYGFAMMVDFYNDIPYTEAFLGDAESPNFDPKFDAGYDVYKDLIARIDVALAKEATELTEAQANSDFLFGGDYDQWVRFANTLKLRMYLRMTYSHPAEAEAGVRSLEGAEFLASDAALKMFVNSENQDNPLYASDRRKLNVGTNLRVSTTLYRYFEQNADPRLASILQDPTKNKPMPQGGYNIPTTQLDAPAVCVFKLAATDPVYFISDVESYLLQSEAVMRGWLTGDAKALYDMGVTAEFTRKGLDGSALIADGGVYAYPSTGTAEEKLEAIIMAKWAAFAGSQGHEAFFEQCRTGYPAVSAVPAWDKDNGSYNDAYVGGKIVYSIEGTTSGAFPMRLIYPQDEINLNANCPAQTAITDKVWWNKR